MTSTEVKATFTAAGINVRVRDLKNKFRICTISGEPHNKTAASAVAASIQCTDVLGRPGGAFLQAHEMVAYKPGSIRRV
jgi:hypothetical protein